MRTIKKPDISIKREYDARAIFRAESLRTDEVVDEPYDYHEKSLEEKIEDLKSLTEISFSPIRQSLVESLDHMLDALRKIEKTEKDIILDKPYASDKQPPDAPDDPDLPTPLSLPEPSLSSDTYIELEQNEITKGIINDFTDKTLASLVGFYRNISNVITDAGFAEDYNIFEEFSIHTKELPDEFKHLSDLIYRNKVSKEQKGRFLPKNHNKEITYQYIRKLESAKEQKKRLFQTDTREEKDYLDYEKNNLLSHSQRIYDKRCDIAAQDFYKYLNSTVILIEEYLDTIIQETKAKGVLYKAGVID